MIDSPVLISNKNYKITFVNSQLENTNSRGDFVLKNVLFKGCW